MQTITQLETRGQGRVAVWTRRGFLVLLLVFVLAGLASLLGVRTTTASAEEAGWTVSLEYASIARPGLDVPWQVTVTHPGGFGKELTLAVTGAYFDIYETQGYWPQPSDMTRDANTVYMTFSAPHGDTFTLVYDAYIQPASQIGRSGSVSVMDDGARVATVDFDTRLWP